MALRFDGFQPFGRIKAARFVDDEDPSFLHYEDDPGMAQRLGAPDFSDDRLAPSAPRKPADRRLASNDVQRPNDVDPSIVSKLPMEYDGKADVPPGQLYGPGEQQAQEAVAGSSVFGGSPSGGDDQPLDEFQMQRSQAAANPTPPREGVTTVEEPKAMQDFGPGQRPTFSPGRTVKTSDGGMTKMSEQTSTTRPGGLNWTDEGGNPVDIQQDLYERTARNTEEKKRIAKEEHDQAGRQVVAKERADFEDLKAGWAREDAARNDPNNPDANYSDEVRVKTGKKDAQGQDVYETQRREYYGTTKAEASRRALAADLQEAKEGRIDAKRVDRQRSIGDTILAAVGLFADGYGGTNRMTNTLQAARDADVKSQIEEKNKRIERAGTALQSYDDRQPNDYEQGLARGLSPDAAKEYAKAKYTATQQYFLNRPDWQSMLKANKTELDKYNVQLDDEMVKSIDSINKNVQVQTQEASRNLPPTYMTIGGTPKLNEHTILDNGRDTGMEWTTNDQEVKRAYGMADDAGAELAEARRTLEEYGESPRLADDETRGKMEADMGRAAALISKWQGQGAISANDVSIPAQLGDDPQAKIKYLNRMKGALSSGVRATARSKQRILGRNAAPTGTVYHKRTSSK